MTEVPRGALATDEIAQTVLGISRNDMGIVRELRTNKQRRQVIVPTHNPNIVVNGNADLVIPLHNQNDQTDIPVRGALQDAKVREWVCDIMQGDREALERRFTCIIHN